MRPALRPRLLGLILSAATLALTACDGHGPVQPHLTVSRPSYAIQSNVPPQGTDTTLDVGNWNVLWFGSTSYGPTDEALQLQNVADVMSGANLDVWGLEEVVDVNQFDSLVAMLPGYAGIVANDPFVTDGAAYYSDFNNTEQKVALVYDTSEVTVHSARVILESYDYDFAGRPPVEFQTTVNVNGHSEDLVIIVLHAKAGSDGASYNRRDAAAQALKSYLDTTWPTQKVMVIGDFNDDVDTSISSGQPSPYRYFVDDSARYTFPTKALSDAGISTEVNYSDAIDHQLDTNEMEATYVPGTVEAFRADQYIANYGTTTSDHYPVIAHYSVTGGGGGGGNQAPTASFTYSCTDLSCTFDGSGSSDPEDGPLTYAWTFGDGATASGVTAAHTYASGATYTVGLTVTDTAGAVGSTSQQVTATAAGSSAGRLWINEIEANPAGTDTGNEWAEIYNSDTLSVDLTGWAVTAHGGNAVSVTLSGSIPAGGFLVVTNPSQWLDNSGEWLTLANAQGAQMDSTPTFDDGYNDDRTWQRTPDGGSTWEFRSGTEGVSNSTAAAQITLTATGYKVHGRQRVDLSWSGATSAQVDIYRDGVLVATTANDGAYTDAIDAHGSGTYVHKVCEAGTATCSNETTTVF